MRMGTVMVWMAGLLLAACTWSPAAPVAGYVDLSRLEPLPTPVRNEVVPLRVAVAAVISPKNTLESYEPLLRYLEQRLGRPVEIVQRRDYATVNRLLEQGQVDVGFVCTSSYLLEENKGARVLVVPQVRGRITYRALLLVPATSTAHDLEDLRGGVFAFTDPLSFTGRAVPLYWLLQMGETPERFFKRTFFTYSHDKAIASVAEGLADGASVDSLVYAFALQRDPELEHKVRVIRVSRPYGIPPVIVGPNVRPQMWSRLQEIFLHMHEDPEGRAALQALGYDRWVLPPPGLYDSAREVYRAVQPYLEAP